MLNAYMSIRAACCIDSRKPRSENRIAPRDLHNMIPRWLLIVLVLALPILILTFAVMMGGSALTGAMGDSAGSYGLFWCAMAALLLMTIDALLLLIVLGVRALDDWEGKERP